MGEAPNTTRVRRVPECLEDATAIAREVAEIVVERPARPRTTSCARLALGACLQLFPNLLPRVGKCLT